MTSATSTDDDVLHKTAAAPCGFSSLPLDLISTHILRSDFLPEPGDLRSLRAVSRGMRDAVDATGREIKKLSNLEAAELGDLSLLKDRRTRGLPSYFWEEETRFFVLTKGIKREKKEDEKWPRKDRVDSRNRPRDKPEALRCALGPPQNACPWDEWPCAYAARGGHLETLKWLRENGCPWHKWTCACAAETGHLEVLKWAREND